MKILIAWDDRKNEANFKKHGVWFEEAQEVVLNSLSLVVDNGHASGERLEYLGISSTLKLLYVVTTEKDEEEVRIISARKATANERKKYEEGV